MYYIGWCGVSGATQHHSKTPSYTRESKSCRHHQPDWLIPTTCSNTTLLLAVSYITLAHTSSIEEYNRYTYHVHTHGCVY